MHRRGLTREFLEEQIKRVTFLTSPCFGDSRYYCCRRRGFDDWEVAAPIKEINRKSRVRKAGAGHWPLCRQHYRGSRGEIGRPWRGPPSKGRSLSGSAALDTPVSTCLRTPTLGLAAGGYHLRRCSLEGSPDALRELPFHLAGKTAFKSGSGPAKPAPHDPGDEQRGFPPPFCPFAVGSWHKCECWARPKVLSGTVQAGPRVLACDATVQTASNPALGWDPRQRPLWRPAGLGVVTEVQTLTAGASHVGSQGPSERR